MNAVPGDNNRGWIGVDLDGTLAHYDHWRGPDHIGHPVPRMVERVKQWRREGIEVRIFTARVAGGPEHVIPVQAWSQEHIGEILPVTNVKDYAMEELWDDRARQVGFCTGVLIVCSHVYHDLNAIPKSPSCPDCGCGLLDR